MNIILIIPNKNSSIITSYKKAHKLSKKSITTKVRKKLRELFPNENVKVSCEARKQNNQWKGRYWINGKQYDYIVL